MLAASQSCRRLGAWLSGGVLLLAAGAVGAGEATPALPEVRRVLAELDRSARLYRDNALRFTCDETIVHDPGFRRQILRFRYIYAFDAAEGLVDYRLPRLAGGKDRSRKLGPKKLERRTRRVDLADYDVPTLLSRAYSWIFLFESARQSRFRYELQGGETRLGRPSVRLHFQPRSPFQEGVNDWVGTAWVDRETFQLLHVEALKLSEYRSQQALHRSLREAPTWPRGERRSHAVFDVKTTYGVERQGMRFPSEVVLQTALYVVKGGRRDKPLEQRPGITVRQIYDNYRFYDVDTSGRRGRLFEPGRQR